MKSFVSTLTLLTLLLCSFSGPTVTGGITIKPGETHDVGGGTIVDNTGGHGGGNFTAAGTQWTDGEGRKGSGNSITAKPRAKGEVTGAHAGDTITLGNGSEVTVSGTDCSVVSAGKKFTVTVTNTGPGTIHCELGGVVFDVPPGPPITFTGGQ
jgi:hypothetical protein